MIPVRAEILQVSGFSAHADRGEIQRWMQGFTAAPLQTLLVHGEPDALAALQKQVAARGWPVRVPLHLETVELAGG
jgi:metallo-beta-lactamase family protein